MLNNLRNYLKSEPPKQSQPNNVTPPSSSNNNNSSNKRGKTAVLSVGVDLEQAFGKPTTSDQDAFIFGNSAIRLASNTQRHAKGNEDPNLLFVRNPAPESFLIFKTPGGVVTGGDIMVGGGFRNSDSDFLPRPSLKKKSIVLDSNNNNRLVPASTEKKKTILLQESGTAASPSSRKISTINKTIVLDDELTTATTTSPIKKKRIVLQTPLNNTPSPSSSSLVGSSKKTSLQVTAFSSSPSLDGERIKFEEKEKRRKSQVAAIRQDESGQKESALAISSSSKELPQPPPRKSLFDEQRHELLDRKRQQQMKEEQRRQKVIQETLERMRANEQMNEPRLPSTNGKVIQRERKLSNTPPITLDMISTSAKTSQQKPLSQKRSLIRIDQSKSLPSSSRSTSLPTSDRKSSRDNLTPSPLSQSSSEETVTTREKSKDLKARKSSPRSSEPIRSPIDSEGEMEPKETNKKEDYSITIASPDSIKSKDNVTVENKIAVDMQNEMSLPKLPLEPLVGEYASEMNLTNETIEPLRQKEKEQSSPFISKPEKTDSTKKSSPTKSEDVFETISKETNSKNADNGLPITSSFIRNGGIRHFSGETQLESGLTETTNDISFTRTMEESRSSKETESSAANITKNSVSPLVEVSRTTPVKVQPIESKSRTPPSVPKPQPPPSDDHVMKTKVETPPPPIVAMKLPVAPTLPPPFEDEIKPSIISLKPQPPPTIESPSLPGEMEKLAKGLFMSQQSPPKNEVTASVGKLRATPPSIPKPQPPTPMVEEVYSSEVKTKEDEIQEQSLDASKPGNLSPKKSRINMKKFPVDDLKVDEDKGKLSPKKLRSRLRAVSLEGSDSPKMKLTKEPVAVAPQKIPIPPQHARPIPPPPASIETLREEERKGNSSPTSFRPASKRSNDLKNDSANVTGSPTFRSARKSSVETQETSTANFSPTSRSGKRNQIPEEVVQPQSDVPVRPKRSAPQKSATPTSDAGPTSLPRPKRPPVDKSNQEVSSEKKMDFSTAKEVIEKHMHEIPTPMKRSESENRLAGKCRSLLEQRKARECITLLDDWKKLNHKSFEAFFLAGKAYLYLGDASKSEQNLKSALDLSGDNEELKHSVSREINHLKTMTSSKDKCIDDLGKKSGGNALSHASRAAEISFLSPQLCILKAAAYLAGSRGGENVDNPVEISKEVQQKFRLEIDKAMDLAKDDVIIQVGRPCAIYARVLHRVGSTYEADCLLDEICTRSPDLAACCSDLLRLFRMMESAKSDANEAYSQGKYTESIRLFTDALALDPTNDLFNSILLSNRAASHMALGDFSRALEDCDSALKLVPSFVRARLRRARTLLRLRKYRESIADFELVYRATPSDSLANEILEAKRGYKEHLRGFPRSTSAPSPLFGKIPTAPPKPPPPPTRPPKENYYTVLGITPQASSADIKKAYHRAALKHHPDKNVGDEDAAHRFKKVLEAFNTLSDPLTRRRYDLTCNAVGVPLI